MLSNRRFLLPLIIFLLILSISALAAQDTSTAPTPTVTLQPSPSFTANFSTSLPTRPYPHLPVVPTVNLNRTILDIRLVTWDPRPNGNLVALGENFRDSPNQIGSPAISIRDTRDMSVVLELFPNERGERNLINTLTWSPDGHYLAAGMMDGTIIIWNVNDPSRSAGELITTLQNDSQNRKGNIYSRPKDIKWSPNGQWFASVSNNQSIHLWNVQDNYSLLDSIQTKISDFGVNLTWSPDSNWLAVGAMDEVNVFKVSEKGHFVPKNSYKLGSPQDRFVFVTDLVWNSSGSELAVLDTQMATLYIYDTLTHLYIRKLATNINPSSLIWSSDGSYFAYESVYDNIYVMDSETGQVLHSYLPPRHIYLDINLNAGNTLIALSYSFDEAIGATELKVIAPLDSSVNFIRPTNTPTPVGTPVSQRTQVNVIALSPQSQSHLLAVSGMTYSADFGVIKFFLRVENTDDMSVVLDLIPLEKAGLPQIVAAAWSPDGKYLASGSTDGMVTIWNIADPSQPAGKVMRQFNTSTDDQRDIGWSPNGKWFTTMTSDFIRLWNINNNFSLLDTRIGAITSPFSWNPDSQRILIGGEIYHISSDGRFSDVNDFFLGDVQQFSRVTSPVWNVTGTQIAFIDGETPAIRVFDLQTHTDFRQLTLPKLTAGYYGTLAWSPDGKYFAYAENRKVHVLDSTSGEVFGIYSIESDQGLPAIIWTADSKHILFTGSKEASAMVTIPDKNSPVSAQKILILQDIPN